MNRNNCSLWLSSWRSKGGEMRTLLSVDCRDPLSERCFFLLLGGSCWEQSRTGVRPIFSSSTARIDLEIKKKTQSMERGKMDGIASDRGGDEEEEEKEKERKKGSPPTGSPTSPRAEQKPLLRLRT